MKNTLTNRKCEELFYPQKSEDVRSHSNNSIENATPSNGTSPEASYKEVPPPPPTKSSDSKSSKRSTSTVRQKNKQSEV